jgi:imidazolonepropionase
MSKLLLKNINTLYSTYKTSPPVLKGKSMNEVPFIEDAWLACEDGLVIDFGRMEDFPGITDWKNLEVVDCAGRNVFPCFIDSHTHIVYDGNRVQEFGDRLRGLTYEEIAARGGGIINSALRLRKCSEDDLFEQSKLRLSEIILQGTGGVEIKSGYGLDLESELKMLRVIRRLRDLEWIPVKATFLGAHAVPPEFKNNKPGYIKLIIEQILPVVANEKVADFIDVFCERNYFSADETLEILEAGSKFGLKGKVHAEQLSHSGGTAAAVNAGAISADHLEFCNNSDIEAIKASQLIPTILPGAAFFLDLQRPPARNMIDSGLPVAIASDYNPGSSPSGNMKLMMAIACVQYKLTAEEAFNASTINSAAAMDLKGKAGCIVRGMAANFILAEAGQSLYSLPYNFGNELRGDVYLKGKRFSGK